MTPGKLGISSFAYRQLESSGVEGRLVILDVPCGFGRHSRWLANMGHDVVAVDISQSRIDAAKAEDTVATPKGSIRWLVADATETISITEKVDVMLVIDFVSEALLRRASDYLRPGGLLIYETFSARGGNWKELPPPGRTEAILAGLFNIHTIRRRAAGPTGFEAEALKLAASAL